MEDTIVAPATPSGKGGVSVVRVSGVGAKVVGEGGLWKAKQALGF